MRKGRNLRCGPLFSWCRRGDSYIGLTGVLVCVGKTAENIEENASFECEGAARLTTGLYTVLYPSAPFSSCPVFTEGARGKAASPSV